MEAEGYNVSADRAFMKSVGAVVRSRLNQGNRLRTRGQTWKLESRQTRNWNKLNARLQQLEIGCRQRSARSDQEVTTASRTPQADRRRAGLAQTARMRSAEAGCVAAHRAGAASAAALHAGLRSAHVHRFLRDSRRPRLWRRSGDDLRHGALPRRRGAGGGHAEGARHQAEGVSQLRHAEPGGLSQGDSRHADGGEVRASDLHLYRHAGRLPWTGRRGARTGRGDCLQPARDVAAEGADPRARSPARAARAARWRLPWATGSSCWKTASIR